MLLQKSVREWISTWKTYKSTKYKKVGTKLKPLYTMTMKEMGLYKTGKKKLIHVCIAISTKQVFSKKQNCQYKTNESFTNPIYEYFCSKSTKIDIFIISCNYRRWPKESSHKSGNCILTITTLWDSIYSMRPLIDSRARVNVQHSFFTRSRSSYDFKHC